MLEAEFMRAAFTAREHADCRGNRVGTVIVVRDEVVATGWNGVPETAGRCTDGVCWRCQQRDELPAGVLYDLCICVHAEQRAMLAAARCGIPIAGGVLYSTLSPCCGCAKELLDAGVVGIRFATRLALPSFVIRVQDLLYSLFPLGARQLLEIS